MKEKIHLFDDEPEDGRETDTNKAEACGGSIDDISELRSEISGVSETSGIPEMSDSHPVSAISEPSAIQEASAISQIPKISETPAISEISATNTPAISTKMQVSESGWQRVVGELFKFLCLTVAVMALMYSVTAFKDKDPEVSNPAVQTDVKDKVTDSLPDTDAVPPVAEGVKIVNECNAEIENIGEDIYGYTLAPLMGTSEGKKVLIVHSHTSESCSSQNSVLDFGALMADQLEISGIGTYHCTDSFDEEGNIGAYGRMNKKLKELLHQYPDIVLVIDLHSSDTESPITLTVAHGVGNGWKENYLLAGSVGTKIPECDVSIRIVPGSLGQRSGVLTLHIGIGGIDEDEKIAKNALYKIISSVIGVCRA